MKKIYIIVLSSFLCVNAFSQIAKNMSLLAHWDADTFPIISGGQYSDIWGITACGGREIAVIGSTPYVHFFDISDVNNIIELAHFKGDGNHLWREFKSYKNRIYGVCDQGAEGLMIFDVSDPDNIVKTNQTTQFFNRTHMPFIDEKNGRLYLAGSNVSGANLIVLDLTQDPDNPTLLANVTLPGGYVHDLFVNDNIAYCSQGPKGLWVYDMNDPTNTILLGNMTSYPESGYNHSTWMTKDKKYLIQCDETHNTSVKMVDIQKLDDIKVVDLFKSALLGPAVTNSIPHNPYVRGNYSIISYYHDGVQVYDVSNPLDVQNVGWYDTEPNNINYNDYAGLWGVYPFFESDKIICSDLFHGLFVVSLDSIDLDSIHAPIMPDATLNFKGDVKVCQLDSVQLVAPFGAMFYNWYKDGKMIYSDKPILNVSKPGKYKVVVWNHACVAESEEVNISFSPIKPPVIENSPPPGICPGDTIKLCTDGSAPIYEWQKDGEILSSTTACQDITSGGNFKILAKDGGCVKATSGITIIQYSLPDDTIDPVTALLCIGDSVELKASDLASTWLWFKDGNAITNSNSNTLTVHESGVYTVSLANDHCGTLSIPATVFVSPGPVASFIFDGTDLIADQAESYQWFLNGVAIPGATGITFTPDKSGTYSLQTTDIVGCIGTSPDMYIIVTATTSLENNYFNIYPNPVKDQLHIVLNTNSGLSDWSIISTTGIVIKSGKFNNNETTGLISTTELTSGTYILSCKGNTKDVKTKFVKN